MLACHEYHTNECSRRAYSQHNNHCDGSKWISYECKLQYLVKYLFFTRELLCHAINYSYSAVERNCES